MKAQRPDQDSQVYGLMVGSIYGFAITNKVLEAGDKIEGEVQTPDGYKVAFIATVPSSKPDRGDISESLNDANDKIYLNFATKKHLGVHIGSLDSPFLGKSPYINWMKVNGVFVEFY